jgi:hypothetical protein
MGDRTLNIDNVQGASASYNNTGGFRSSLSGLKTLKTQPPQPPRTRCCKSSNSATPCVIRSDLAMKTKYANTLLCCKDLTSINPNCAVGYTQYLNSNVVKR